MKKKGWIITGVILIVLIAVIAILSFTLFSLKSVSVDFRTSMEGLSISSEEIIEAGQFNNTSVFFQKKSKNKENIEKTYPYIKVINIETVFPSSFVVHVAVRQEVYAIEQNEKVFYLDETLKVLKEVDDFLLSQDKPILLQGLEIDGEIEVGQTLKVAGFVDLYSSLFASNLDLGAQKTMIEKINFSKEYDSNLKMQQDIATIYMFNGQQYRIVDTSYGLEYKINRLKQIYSNFYNFIGKEVALENGEKKVLSEDDVKSAKFSILSYYDRLSHGENETYFTISI